MRNIKRDERDFGAFAVTTILSADNMGKISAAAIKRMVNGKNGIKMSDQAAAAIAEMLEKKASRIAKYAVGRAKSRKRGTVLEEDIESYRVRFGD